MKKTFVIISLVSLVSLASCDLDLYPETGYNEGNVFVPKDTTTSQYTTAAQMESLVKGFYSGVLKNDRMQRLQFMDWLVYSEVRADNAYNGSPSTAELVGIESNKIDGSNQNVSRDWNDFQIAINAANQVICNIDRIQKLDPSMTPGPARQLAGAGRHTESFLRFQGNPALQHDSGHQFHPGPDHGGEHRGGLSFLLSFPSGQGGDIFPDSEHARVRRPECA